MLKPYHKQTKKQNKNKIRREKKKKKKNIYNLQFVSISMPETD